MRSYFFGYLFVRLNKLLAIIVLLIGAGAAMFFYHQASVSTESNQYRNGDLLLLRLRNLSRVHERTKVIVSEFKRTATYPDKFKEADAKIEYPLQYKNKNDFDLLHESLVKSGDSSTALKTYLAEKFDSLLSEIHRKLISYAQQVSPAESANAAPPAVVIKSTNRETVDQNPWLFDTDLSQSEIDQRLRALKNSQQFLETLEASSENSENKRKLKEAGEELEKFTQLLPEAFESTSEKEDVAPAQTSALPHRKQVNAARVAQTLLQVKAAVSQSILTSWDFDDAYEKAVDAYTTEREKFEAKETANRATWMEAFISIAKAIGCGVAVSFLLLVFADLTKALLDSARYAGVIARPYEGSSTEE